MFQFKNVVQAKKNLGKKKKKELPKSLQNFMKICRRLWNGGGVDKHIFRKEFQPD